MVLSDFARCLSHVLVIYCGLNAFKVVSGTPTFCCSHQICVHLLEHAFCNYSSTSGLLEVPFCGGISFSSPNPSAPSKVRRRVPGSDSTEGSLESSTKATSMEKGAGHRFKQSKLSSTFSTVKNSMWDDQANLQSAAASSSTTESGLLTFDMASPSKMSTAWDVTDAPQIAGLCDCKTSYRMVNESCVRVDDSVSRSEVRCHLFNCTGADQGCLLSQLSTDRFAVGTCSALLGRDFCMVVVQRNTDGSVTERTGCAADCVSRRGSNSAVTCCQDDECNTNAPGLLLNATHPENAASDVMHAQHADLMLLYVFVVQYCNLFN